MPSLLGQERGEGHQSITAAGLTNHTAQYRQCLHRTLQREGERQGERARKIKRGSEKRENVSTRKGVYVV